MLTRPVLDRFTSSVVSFGPNGSVRPNDLLSPKKGRRTINPDRTMAIDALVAGFERLMQQLADNHAADFLEIAVTMPQAKLLYLLGAAGDLHMSELVTRLGVSLSTVSGLVDRIVDAGLATRREDAVDRRQVVVSLTPAGAAYIHPFREHNARQMRELLGELDDSGLAHVRGALEALTVAAERRVERARAANPVTVAPHGAAAPRKDPA
jgi:DNA-binding MarR family transcriptional regulator